MYGISTYIWLFLMVTYGKCRYVNIPWESTTFIFRGYNPYVGGSKPSCFMVLGSKGIYIYVNTVGLPGCIQGLRWELWKKTRKVEKLKSRKVAAKLEKSKSPKSRKVAAKLEKSKSPKSRKVAAKVEKSEKSKSGSKIRKVEKSKNHKSSNSRALAQKSKFVLWNECSWFMISPHPSLNFHSEGVRAIL